MRLNTSWLALLILFLCCVNIVPAQDMLGAQPKKARTREDYQPRTLRRIAAEGLELVRSTAPGATTVVDGNLLPSRVTVTYKGPARSLKQERGEVISQWAQRYAGSPDHYTLPYTSEVRFAERGVDYWLVVKSNDLPEISRDLKRGRAVELYLIRLGAFKTGGKWNWVLLVEDFARAK